MKKIFFLNKKFLLYNLVLRSIKLKYRNSYLGFLWTFLVPVSNALIYVYVISYIMRVDIPYFSLFIVSALLPWTFYSTSLTAGLEAIVANQVLIGKVQIPPHLFIFSEVVTAFINFLFAVPVVLIMWILSDIELSFSIALIPFLILMLFFQAYGASLILGTLYVYFRDIRHLLNIFIQILFYATPILYTSSMVPNHFKWIMYSTPVAFVFDGMYLCLIEGKILDWQKILALTLWTSVIFFIGQFVAIKSSPRIAERL